MASITGVTYTEHEDEEEAGGGEDRRICQHSLPCASVARQANISPAVGTATIAKARRGRRPRGMRDAHREQWCTHNPGS